MMRRSVAALFVLTMVGGGARADFVPEIPGTDGVAVDARSGAMGGAGIASTEETGAIVLNPASIALVRRFEATSTLLYQQRELTSGYFDDTETASLTSGELSAAGFVYPVPVYRGALAFGLLFRRQSVFDRDLLRGGIQPDGGMENELLAETGSMNTWTVGASVQISPSAFLGANISLITGSLRRESDFAYEPPGGTPYEFASLDEMDLSGFRASVGGLFFPSSLLRLGFRIDLPYSVEYSGDQLVFGDATQYVIEEKVRYPMSAGAGIATRALFGLLITADVEFIPYSLIELNGERLRTAERAEAYRDVTIFKAGVEYTLPFAIRLRGGVRQEPEPYRLLLAEVRDNNPSDAVMEVATFAEERYVVTAGAGLLLGSALSVDGAVEWVQAQKAATNVDQTDELARFYLTTSYRF